MKLDNLPTMSSRFGGFPLTVFLPRLHRHIEPQYVDVFRREGNLRLSSFAQFQKHEDEHRGDAMEGTSVHFLHDTKAGKSFVAALRSGLREYVLSATSRTDQQIRDRFGGSSFVIEKPFDFCAAVATQIPGCVSIAIGPCIYTDQRMLIHHGPLPPHGDIQAGVDAVGGPTPLFLKTRNFEWQAEHRFIWTSDQDINAHLDIVSPEAAKCCLFHDA